MNNQSPCRNHPEIQKLYNDRVCTEISMKTGGVCSGDQVCVIPDTPGNISSVCPSEVDNMFTSRIQTRRIKGKRGASKKSKKKVTEGEGRLVGTSTLHTFTTSGPLRYPWMCSLKTRGFRFWKRLRRKISFQGSTPVCPDPPVSSSKRNHPCGDGPLQLFVQGRLLQCRAVLLQTTQPGQLLQWG